MKTGWIIAAIIVALMLVLMSMARRAIDMGMKRSQGIPRLEARQLTGAKDALELEMTFWNVRKDQVVSEIILPASLFVAIDAHTPVGFTMEPLPLTGDDDEREQIARQNEENIRWVGALPLRPNAPTVFRIPASKPGQGSGSIRLRCEGEDNSGALATNIVEVRINPKRR